MGAMQAAYGHADSPDCHLRDTIIGGYYVNDQLLVKKMVDLSRKAAEDLEQLGTTFQKENGKVKLFAFSGCTYPRALVATDPYAGGFIRGLVRGVRELEIQVIEHTMITRLLTKNGAVTGAIGLSSNRGEILTFSAKTTILASGGAGCLYSLTSNPDDVTGDGYALAYQIGAELVDMEFVQTRACIVHPNALRGRPPPADGLVTVGGRFYNGLGERYMKKHDPEKIEKVTRDQMAIRTYKEISEGRAGPHGGVYNDLSDVPKDELGNFATFLRDCKKSGLDPTWQPIEWAPGVHHFMGGVRISEKTETTINHLFACGEVTGGIHGANRLAANALTEMLVFGTIAGRNASESAKRLSTPRKPAEEEIESERNRVFSYLERKEGEDFSRVRTTVQNIMYNYAGVIRREDRLKKAICELNALTKRVRKLYVPGKRDCDQLRRLLETENMIEVGKMVVSAALLRKESRGSHYREDFPKEDNARWLKNIVIRRQNEEMKLEERPVDMTYISPIGSQNHARQKLEET